MSAFIAALPMYDWPETAAHTDAVWSGLRDRLRAAGLDAPERVVRRNADMPAVPGGIRNFIGELLAADPATLPADELDYPTLWHHPALLFGQTCWGPMELGLSDHVTVVGQPDYSDVEGGDGALYSSAIIMRRDEGDPVAAPSGTEPSIPVEHIRGQRFAFNSQDSMSGLIALSRDLASLGESIDIVGARIETGGHRASTRAVAEGRADICTSDCRSWAQTQRFDRDIADRLIVVGWTAKRRGLPYIMANGLAEFAPTLRAALGEAGMLAEQAAT